MSTHPEQIAPELRKQARLILAEATDPTVTWKNENIPKVWERISRIMERAANECELVCKRYLEPDLTVTDKQFMMLSRAIGSRKGEAERAARMVLVQGKKQSEVASETGLSQQGVYAAVERYRKAWLTISQATVNTGEDDEHL